MIHPFCNSVLKRSTNKMNRRFQFDFFISTFLLCPLSTHPKSLRLFHLLPSIWRPFVKVVTCQLHLAHIIAYPKCLMISFDLDTHSHFFGSRYDIDEKRKPTISLSHCYVSPNYKNSFKSKSNFQLFNWKLNLFPKNF